jgi:hypothetical protein
MRNNPFFFFFLNVFFFFFFFFFRVSAWQEQHNKYLDEKLRNESDKIAESREAARVAYDKLVRARYDL